MIVTDLSNSFHPVPKTKVEKKKEVTEMKKKSNKLAKLEKQRTSILQEDSTKCFICGRQTKLDKHEAFGGRNRQRSMKWKLVYYLCRKCHSKADLDKETREFLHKDAKTKFIKQYGKEKFIEEFK